MSDILARIIEVKSREIAAAKAQQSEATLLAEIRQSAADRGYQPRGFLSAIRSKHASGVSAVISEIKRELKYSTNPDAPEF